MNKVIFSLLLLSIFFPDINNETNTILFSDYSRIESITYMYEKSVEVNKKNSNQVSNNVLLEFNIKFNKSKDSTHSTCLKMQNMNAIDTSVINNYNILDNFEFLIDFNSYGTIDTITNYNIFRTRLLKKYDYIISSNDFNYDNVKLFFEFHLISKMCFINQWPIDYNDTIWNKYKTSSYNNIEKLATTVIKDDIRQISTINFDYYFKNNQNNFQKIVCIFDTKKNILKNISVQRKVDKLGEETNSVETFRIKKVVLR